MRGLRLWPGVRRAGRQGEPAADAGPAASQAPRLTGEMLLGPPKSRAGRRVVGIADAIIPALREHLAAFTGAEPGSLVFPGAKGGPIRRGNFNKMSGWPDAVRTIGAGRPAFSRSEAYRQSVQQRRGPEDLMARMGYNSERAALIYQHEARGADKRITDAIDTHVQVEQATDDDDGAAGGLLPVG